LRAITAARLYATGQIPTLAKAATACGSCRPYVAAAVILLKAENASLLSRVLAGQAPLLAAAGECHRLAELVSAYRAATQPDRVTFGSIVGVAEVWDTVIVPQL
jgi:hypothetical protein